MEAVRASSSYSIKEIQALERKYGSLKNVPKNNKDLKKVQRQVQHQNLKVVKDMGTDNRKDLTALSGHLFDQLERMNDDSLTAEQIEDEFKRSQAMVGISKTIVDTAKVALEGEKFKKELGYKSETLPPMIGGGEID